MEKEKKKFASNLPLEYPRGGSMKMNFEPESLLSRSPRAVTSLVLNCIIAPFTASTHIFVLNLFIIAGVQPMYPAPCIPNFLAPYWYSVWIQIKKTLAYIQKKKSLKEDFRYWRITVWNIVWRGFLHIVLACISCLFDSIPDKSNC